MIDEVGVSCLCGRVHENVELKQSFPVDVTPCHCDGCRYTSGGLYISSYPLRTRPISVEILIKYDYSGQIARYFCSICGSHCFLFKPGQNTWYVQSGIVERVPESASGNLDRVVGHRFIEDTKDGGLSVCWLGETDPKPQFFLGEAYKSTSVEPEELMHHLSRSQSETQQTEQLPASCHCGGVQFFITRPDETSKTWSSHWADLIVPYHSNSPENKDDVKWWIRNDHKWLAGTCACRSCRLGLGFPVQTFAFVSKSNIFKEDGEPIAYDFGTLQSYESSPGKFREFCNRCGATVFWHCIERPGVVDVSVGVLRAEEGARACNWLDWWTDRVSFSEDALDTRLVDQLKSGLHSLNS